MLRVLLAIFSVSSSAASRRVAPYTRMRLRVPSVVSTYPVASLWRASWEGVQDASWNRRDLR